jgi:hypothetical protein
MALWHFKFGMIPRKGIERALGKPAAVLEEYQVKEDGPKELTDMPDYWEGMNLAQFENRLAAILPPEPWSGRGPKRFGSAESDRIELWPDDIECAVDLRDFSADHLRGMIEFAASENLALVVHGTGEVVDPDFDAVADRIRTSRAYAFCKDPRGFLRASRQS